MTAKQPILGISVMVYVKSHQTQQKQSMSLQLKGFHVIIQFPGVTGVYQTMNKVHMGMADRLRGTQMNSF